jgi:voltage-gated potassium channel
VNGPGPLGDRRRSWRRRIYELLDPAIETVWDRAVHHGLIALVLINVLAVVLESVPSMADRYGAIFLTIEVVSVVVFTAEYALRLWSCVEHMPYTSHSGWAARLAWARTPAAVVDLVAVLPFYVLVIAPVDLRVVALFRLVRFLKLARYSSGLVSLADAVYVERRSLLATLLILGGLVLTTATLMHLAEERAQPAQFGTIPDAMWWAIVTLTTVGYGDVVPITPVGKLIAGLTAILGVAMLALPVGIIARAFSEVIHRREFVVTWSMVARVPVFANLDAADIAEIMQLLHSRTVPKGEVILRRGEAADAMYFIVSGEVEIEIMDDDHPRLGSGDFFGEIAILTEELRTTTVRACQETQLLVLQAHDLQRLMDRVPEIARRLQRVAEARAPDRVSTTTSPKAKRRQGSRLLPKGSTGQE